MKIKIIMALSLIIFGTANLSYARPPSALDLAYDMEGGVLTISIKHVTKNPRDHHIRKIVVSVNGEEKQVIRHVTQSTSQGLTESVALGAVEGDLISVKAICNEAGYKSASIVVTPEENQPEK